VRQGRPFVDVPPDLVEVAVVAAALEGYAAAQRRSASPRSGGSASTPWTLAARQDALR
jgi:hypothetical protein